ncbi:MAG: hypothetical protein Q7S29_01795 [Candidatus Peribacter sp.]|nr:hypothetical protein [Candidatus Peribacter sp.]
MMINRRHLAIVAAAAVLVVVAAGISSLQYAELVSDSGVDPNIAQESVRNARRSRIRIHSLDSILRRVTVNRGATSSEEATYGSAKELPQAERGCRGLTGQRLTRCNAGVKITNETAR